MMNASPTGYTYPLKSVRLNSYRAGHIPDMTRSTKESMSETITWSASLLFSAGTPPNQHTNAQSTPIIAGDNYISAKISPELRNIDPLKSPLCVNQQLKTA